MSQNYKYGWICNIAGWIVFGLGFPWAAVPMFVAALYYFLVAKDE